MPSPPATKQVYQPGVLSWQLEAHEPTNWREVMSLMRQEEVALLVWLREYFGLPSDLPLGLSQDGELELVAWSVTTFVLSGLEIAQQVCPGVDAIDAYTANLENLQSSVEHPRDGISLTSPAYAYVKELLGVVTEERENIVRISREFPRVLPEIHRRYGNGTEDAWESLVARLTGELATRLETSLT